MRQKNESLISWREAALERIHAQGYLDLECFLRNHQNETYVALSRRVGGIVTPLQLVKLQFETAKVNGKTREAALDALARELRLHTKRGWDVGPNAASNRAGAYAFWTSYIRFQASAEELQPLARAAWDALVAANPPKTWVPNGPTDAILVAAFASGWPKH